MSHELAAAGFGLLVLAVQVGGSQLLGDDVYARKSAVVRSAALTALVAAAGYYVAGGPAL